MSRSDSYLNASQQALNIFQCDLYEVLNLNYELLFKCKKLLLTFKRFLYQRRSLMH